MNYSKGEIQKRNQRSKGNSLELEKQLAEFRDTKLHDLVTINILAFLFMSGCFSFKGTDNDIVYNEDAIKRYSI